MFKTIIHICIENNLIATKLSQKQQKSQVKLSKLSKDIIKIGTRQNFLIKNAIGVYRNARSLALLSFIRVDSIESAYYKHNNWQLPG